MGLEWSSASESCCVPPLSRSEAVLLANRTHYQAEEVQQLYHRFYRDIAAVSSHLDEEPNQGVGFPLFCTCAAFLGVKSPLLQEMFFIAFDRNRDGVIVFDEFLTVLSIMSRGTAEEKTDLAFDMFYCINAYPHSMSPSSCTLRRNGMLLVVQELEAVFDDNRASHRQQKQQHPVVPSAQDVLNNLFADGDEVTRDEFVAYAYRCPAIVNGLALHFQ